MAGLLLQADPGLFYRRLSRIYDAWDELIKTDAIFMPVGKPGEVETSFKSSAVHHWLFNQEISDLLMIFTKSNIYFLSNRRKIDFLRSLKDKAPSSGNHPKIVLLARDKNDSDKANFEKLVAETKSLKTIGYLKEKHEGDFYEQCKSLLFKPEDAYEFKDVNPALAYIMAVKEDIELQYIQKACNATESTYKKGLISEFITIIDREKKVPHSKLSERLDLSFSRDPSRYVDNLDPKSLETCFTPIIQSGGNYELKFSKTSSDDNIHYATIISSVGIKFKRYCSNISRTLMTAPSEEQKKNYEFLLQVSDELINRLSDGVVLSDLYKQIVDYVKSKRPDLVDKLTKNFGFATGTEFRERHLLISPNNNFKAKKNMVFIIAIGFNDLVNRSASDSSSKNYALFLSDTVVVNDKGQPAQLLTTKRRKLNKTSIELREENGVEEDDEENNERNNLDSEAIITEQLRGGRRRVLEDRLRQEQNNDERRRLHQRELLVQVNETAKARLSKSSGGKVETKVKKSVVAYKSVKDFPRENEISDLKIYVDKKNETVILPVFGVPVPFHISTIKNVSTSVEGDYLYLRINFFFPGSTLEKGSVFPTNEATFLKELTYRSFALKEVGEVNSPSQNLQDSFVLIKTVQKKFKTRVDEEKELEGVVKQDNLIISTNKVGPKLKDLFIRPNIYQKRISGSLEAHANGFRFTSIKNDKVDIMYNNIKHAIYQPCDGEMIILLHFNLKNPIMLNKKKHFDIQLYTEVGEITTDLGKRQHMHDRDDYAAEAAERELRNRLKQAFKSFCDKVEAKGDISFEMPLREFSFYGVPKKSNVLLQPTSNALVNLTDPDPTVITLSEIEIVHFERVSFQLKNFDITIVFKDYTIKPLSIAAVEMCKLEEIKNWLDRCDIKFTSGVTNLNWPAIMKRITSNPDGFFEEGGWAFLDDDVDDENPEEEEEEEDDQYTPSDEESEESEDEEESDVTEEESDDSGSNDVGSDEESGKEWSELEDEAEEADRNNRDYEDSGSRRRNPVASSAKRKSYDDGRGGSKKRR